MLRRRVVPFALAAAVTAVGLAAAPAVAGPSLGLSASAPRVAADAQPVAALGVMAPPGPLSDRRINLDSDPPEPQFDPHVAASLLDPDVAVAAFTDRAQGGIQIARTTDGGRTWAASFLTARNALDGTPCLTSEPQVAFSLRDRAFYLLMACTEAASSLAEAQLIASTDDGATWTPTRYAALAAANHVPGDPATIDPAVFPDWLALAVDNTRSSPHFGRVYAGYVRFQSTPDLSAVASCPAHVAFTDQVPAITPADATWTDVAVMPPGTATDLSAASQVRLAVDDRGGVDVLYANEDCNSYVDAGIAFSRSADGGATYAPARHITRPGTFRDNPDPGDVLADKGTQALISPSIAFNPVEGTLHAVYHDFREGGRAASDISHQRSADLGETWSRARTISFRRRGRPARGDQLLPWITADALTGDLHAIWLDSRNDRGNVRVEAFQGRSTDDGRRWTNTDVASASWDPRIGLRGRPFAGNRNAIAALGDRVYPLWGDARDPGPIDQGFGGLDVFTNPQPGSQAAGR